MPSPESSSLLKESHHFAESRSQAFETIPEILSDPHRPKMEPPMVAAADASLRFRRVASIVPLSSSLEASKNPRDFGRGCAQRDRAPMMTGMKQRATRSHRRLVPSGRGQWITQSVWASRRSTTIFRASSPESGNTSKQGSIPSLARNPRSESQNVVSLETGRGHAREPGPWRRHSGRPSAPRPYPSGCHGPP